MENYYKKIEKRFIMAAIGTNDNARQGDVNRNHVNYGYCKAWAVALDDMGHEVSLPVYEEDGFLKIPYLEIDGVKIAKFE
jgi:hypothetical protein